MRVKYKTSQHDKNGTIRFVYQQDGYKYFDILFDGEDILSTAWSKMDRKHLKFTQEEYKLDFEKMLKEKKK